MRRKSKMKKIKHNVGTTKGYHDFHFKNTYGYEGFGKLEIDRWCRACEWFDVFENGVCAE